MYTTRAATREIRRDNGCFGPSEKPANLSILFASRQRSEVIPQALTRVTVPEGNCDGRLNPRERVVVLDSDPSHAVSLSDALSRRFHVTSFRTKEMFAEALKKNRADFAVIVFRSPSWWRNELQSFCDAVRRMDEPPEIICILRWPPEGPGDRLFGDELNLVVFHER